MFCGNYVFSSIYSYCLGNIKCIGIVLLMCCYSLHCFFVKFDYGVVIEVVSIVY